MARRLLSGILFTLVAVIGVTVLTQAKEGRWKLDGNGACVFDATDDGPDQCSATVGRWKIDGDGGCVFDASDSGPDQCSPATEPTSEVPAAERQVGADGAEGGGPGQHSDVAR